MVMRQTTMSVVLLAASVFLSGCVAGQSIKMDFLISSTAETTRIGSANVLVTDDRPFIVDHDKRPSYLGHFRAGFGNTWAVTTHEDEALAEKMQHDLATDLNAMRCVSRDDIAGACCRASDRVV